MRLETVLGAALLLSACHDNNNGNPPALTSIVVTPNSTSIDQVVTQPFSATGTFTDGSMQDVTTQVIWASTDPAVASVSNAAGSNGLATGVGAGSTTISATLSGVTGMTVLTVTSMVGFDPLVTNLIQDQTTETGEPLEVNGKIFAFPTSENAFDDVLPPDNGSVVD